MDITSELVQHLPVLIVAVIIVILAVILSLILRLLISYRLEKDKRATTEYKIKNETSDK